MENNNPIKRELSLIEMIEVSNLMNKELLEIYTKCMALLQFTHVQLEKKEVSDFVRKEIHEIENMFDVSAQKVKDAYYKNTKDVNPNDN